MDRRQFLRRAVITGAGGAVLPTIAMAGGPAGAQTAAPGDGPYGPLATEPDENGLLLPEGFTSRIVAVAGEPVAGTDYVWPIFPDGAATFETPDGGWIHTVNSEVFDFVLPASGGVSAVRYDKDGEIVDAYPILTGSTSNCAGGPTPWGTWLSCEEDFAGLGRVFECDPTGERDAVAHPAMGLCTHEAVAVHEPSETLYLTEDNAASVLFRYTPTAYPDLSAGLLEAATVASDGSVTWAEVPDPSAATTPLREQVPGATTFPGAEGIWCHEDTIYFTTKIDHSVHAIDVVAGTYELVWKGDPDGLGIEGAVLSGVDNITVDAGTGDLFVAEDGGNMEVVVISAEGEVAPFARITGADHEGSEVTGPCFNPARDRLYFSSQRGPSSKTMAETLPGAGGEGFGIGVTYEVTGPFRGRVVPGSEDDGGETPNPSTTLANAGNGPAEGGDSPDAGSDGDGDGDDGSSVTPLVIGGLVVGAAAGAVLALRNRNGGAASSAAFSEGEADPSGDGGGPAD
jgi:hypothetical protein